jgi:Leucine-rich repeat (LRR) protein
MVVLNREYLKEKFLQSESELTQCSEIDLRECEITSIEAHTFEGLRNVNKFILVKSRLETLDLSVFSGLASLKMLFLHENPVREIEKAGSASSLKNLTAVSFSMNCLVNLDERLFRGMSNLCELYLSLNKITSIPESTFAGLKNLGKLYLNYNEMKCIEPRWFLDLSRLTHLNLAANLFTDINPLWFQPLVSLRELELDRNQIENIQASSFPCFNRLIVATFQQTSPVSPAAVIKSLSQLSRVCLSKNKLAHVNDRLFLSFDHVQRLYLDGNRLSSLDADSFQRLIYLTVIDLSGNQLTAFHSSTFLGLVFLEQLWLNDNYLAHIRPRSFSDLASLEVLMLDNNKLEAIDDLALFSGLAASVQLITLHGNSKKFISYRHVKFNASEEKYGPGFLHSFPLINLDRARLTADFKHFLEFNFSKDLSDASNESDDEIF